MSLFQCICAPSKIQIKQLVNSIFQLWFHLTKMILFSKIMRFCTAQKSMKITLDKNSGLHVFSVRLCVFIPIFQLCWKLWFHFKSLTFEKFVVIWLNIVTKGFLFQNSTYKKCNVEKLKNALLFIKKFWNVFPYSVIKNSTFQKWVIILRIRKRKFFYRV